MVRPDTVYVGQQTNYQVGVFLSDGVRARLRRNPEFVPPEMSGVLGYDLPVAHVMMDGADGVNYEAHVFERAIFPLTAGTITIPAARLSYSLPISRSFFSREESFALRTEPVRLVALAPPEEGRPATFTGAVGSNLVLQLTADAAGARVGDPLLVIGRIFGSGNVGLLPRPRLELEWGNVVDAGERVTLDTTARVIRGSKEFDWLVTPRQAGRQSLPEIHYSYFDPVNVSYRTALSSPGSVEVGDGVIVALDTASGSGVELLSLRARLGPVVRMPPASSPFYWLVIALAPLPAVVTRLRRARVARRPDATARERLRELAHDVDGATSGPANPRAEAGELRVTLLSALAERLGLVELPSRDASSLVRTLRLEGVTSATATSAATLLARLDHAAFSPYGEATAPIRVDGSAATAVDTPTVGVARAGVRALATEALALFMAVDVEARGGRPANADAPKTRGGAAALFARQRSVGGGGGRGRHVALLLVALGVGALHVGNGVREAGAAPSSAPRPFIQGAASPAVDPASTSSTPSTFDHGVERYRAGEFVAARDSFAAVARLLPRSADAWANAGTAAWAAGDTTGAAVGWQRALRLQPNAVDVRLRLQLIPGDQLSGAAALPRIPPSFAQWAALLGWIAAWGMAFASIAAGGPLITRVVGLLLLLAAASGAAAALMSERMAARDLYLVTPGSTLRTLPALSAPTVRPLAAGELLQLRSRAGVWSRVTVGDASGWIEGERLRALRAD